MKIQRGVSRIGIEMSNGSYVRLSIRQSFWQRIIGKFWIEGDYRSDADSDNFVHEGHIERRLLAWGDGLTLEFQGEEDETMS